MAGRVDDDVVVGDPGDAERHQHQREDEPRRRHGPRSGARGSRALSLDTGAPGSVREVVRGPRVTRGHALVRTGLGRTPGYLSQREHRIPRAAHLARRRATRPAVAVGASALAARHAAGRARLRRAVRGQRPHQRGHRPAAGPLRRPGLAGRRRGRQRTPSCATTGRGADAEVTMLTTRSTTATCAATSARSSALGDPAGLSRAPRPGRGHLLSDAPEDVIDATTGDKNLLVVHQQDIQAVVNAMWKGGASAVTIQGQRMVTTTGIKCEGNSVQLQGVPYPQPYVIQASVTWARCSPPSPTTPTCRSTARQADDPDDRRRLGPRHRGRAHRAGVRRPARPLLRDPAQAVRQRRPPSPGARSPRPRRGRGSVGVSVGSVVGVSVGLGVSRRLEGRHEDGDRRALRTASRRRAGSGRSRCRPARWSSACSMTSRLEAGVADRCLGVAPAARPRPAPGRARR